MLDYQTLTAAVSAARSAFAAAAPGIDPEVVTDVNASFGEPGPFMLGALYQHLLRHAGPSVQEITHLQHAATLWQTVIAISGRIATLRTTVENLAITPPDAAKIDAVTQAVADAEVIKTDLTSALGQARVLIAALSPVDYAGVHPVAAGRAVADWPWFELSIARRSGAFVANLALLTQSSPHDSAEARAFAHGALVGYAVNARGGDFLNDVVGGARRGHLYRHKLAANTVGAWLGVNDAGRTMPLTALRDLIGATQAGAIDGLVTAALVRTYPTLATKPLPDVTAAVTTMARHLDLLTRFTPLPLPANSPTAVLRLVDSTGANGVAQGQLTPQALHPLAPAGEFSDESPFEDNTVLDWIFSPCEALAWAVGKVLEALAFIAVKIGLIEPGSPFAATQAQAVVTSQEYLVAVELFRFLHFRLYSECQDALTALKLLGIAYPEPQDLPVHPYQQFTVIPRKELTFHLPQATPSKYLEYPKTPTELPVSTPSSRTFGQLPTTILGSSAFAVELLVASSDPNPEPSTANANTDADRGAGALCWRLLTAPGADPLGAALLAYDEI